MPRVVRWVPTGRNRKEFLTIVDTHSCLAHVFLSDLPPPKQAISWVGLLRLKIQVFGVRLGPMKYFLSKSFT